MSSITKSKSKDKKAGKEQKTPSKSSSSAVNGGNGSSSSAYNPLLGTFHTLEASSTFSAPTLLVNGRFQNIDDSDDHSGTTHGSGGDYDSASNNDSRSVESEEHNKEKPTNDPPKKEAIPGAENDKREKIRLKNERKHQRQKERRAQELHERCSGYLMSRKLEALAQQIVAMGISHERATMALILNEGRVEEAVTWLFEVNEDNTNNEDQNIDTGSNLKIDISEELGRIGELEIKYKCSKQEVERAIVTCEGDLEKAEENLRSQKQDQSAISPKPGESSDPSTFSNGKTYVGPSQANTKLFQTKLDSAALIPQRRDEKDFNYTKGGVTKQGAKTMQPVTSVQPKLEWARPQPVTTPSEKRWPLASGSSPSVSYSLAPPLQVSTPPVKAESQYENVGNEYKNLVPGSIREPVVMMQRPESLKVKPSPVNSNGPLLSGSTTGWHPPNLEILKSNGLPTQIPSTRSPSPSNLTSNQFYHPTQYPQQHQQFMPGNSPVDNPRVSFRGNSSGSRLNGSSTIAPASSLGLFSSMGSTSTFTSGPNSFVDWNTSGSMPSCDYTNIDWSLNRSFLPSKQNGLWVGGSDAYLRSGSHLYDTGASAMGVMRPSNGNGVPIVGLKEGGTGMFDSSGASSREWTSPFEGKDLFSLPRQFLHSPSL